MLRVLVLNPQFTAHVQPFNDSVDIQIITFSQHSSVTSFCPSLVSCINEIKFYCTVSQTTLQKVSFLRVTNGDI